MSNFCVMFFTHCINNRWFASIAELLLIDWGKSPSSVVFSNANGEWGTTWTPWTPSRVLIGFNIAWGLISFSVVNSIKLIASMNLLASIEMSEPKATEYVAWFCNRKQQWNYFRYEHNENEEIKSGKASTKRCKEKVLYSNIT